MTETRPVFKSSFSGGKWVDCSAANRPSEAKLLFCTRLASDAEASGKLPTSSDVCEARWILFTIKKIIRRFTPRQLRLGPWEVSVNLLQGDKIAQVMLFRVTKIDAVLLLSAIMLPDC